MKKLLSVLLSVAMIIGCLSICFSSFAASYSTVEELVDKINEETAIAAEGDENGHTSGYLFSQAITNIANTDVMGDDMNLLKTIIVEKYPEYQDYLITTALGWECHCDGCETCQNNGRSSCSADDPCDCSDCDCHVTDTMTTPDWALIYKAASGVEEIADTQVKKNANASDVLGDYALKATTLSADKISGFSSSGAGYFLNVDDIDITADELVSESALAEFLPVLPNFDGMDDQIKDRAKEKQTGINFQDLQITLSNITIYVGFDSEDRINELYAEYDLVLSATAKLTMEVLSVDQATISVKSMYSGFDHFKDGDFDNKEFVENFNAATAYAVDSKAGYSYTRIADYPYDNFAHFTIDLSDTSVVGSVLDMIGSQYLNPIVNNGIKKIIVNVDDNFETDFQALGWKCECGKCSTCSRSECTADDPCDCADCNCHFELVSVSDSLKDAIGSVVGRVQETLQSGIPEVFDFGAYNATVPAGKNASAYVKEDYAFKKTDLRVEDIDGDAMFDGVDTFTFMIPTQVDPDENSALGHITDDYTTSSEVADAVKLGFLSTFGVDLFKQSDSTLNSTGVVYDNIMVSVKFEEADDTNRYGNGKIESVRMMYLAMAQTGVAINGGAPIISMDFGVMNSSSYDDFNYKDYEKGDADVSGRVSIIDAKLVLKHIVGTETITGLGFELADMNEDGELKLGDAKAILAKIAADASAPDDTTDTGDDTGDTGSDTGDTGSDTGDTGSDTGDTGSDTGDLANG